MEEVDSRLPDSEPTPSAIWDQDAAKRSLDELFTLTFQYRSSKSYQGLVDFVSRFPFYSPYNAMLIHIQKPGSTFVAPPSRWLDRFGRKIKPGAQPLVILRPMGPVMFVFDVSDTEPTQDACPLPPEVEKPFEVRSGRIGNELVKVTENAKRDGIRITPAKHGSQAAGSIRSVHSNLGTQLRFQNGYDKERNPIIINIPVRYEILINENLSEEAQFATIVHELSHLYCGHLGTPNERWWPDRRGRESALNEFEAESVTYMVCNRLNIDTPADQYLAGYLEKNDRVPPISLECVMKTAGLIETMSLGRLKKRKEK